jgi:hypothetical protein
MKYIVFRTMRPFSQGQYEEVFVAFPHSLIHADISDRCGMRAVSAGFVGKDGICHGRSETMNLDSRPEDTKLLEQMRESEGVEP